LLLEKLISTPKKIRRKEIYHDINSKPVRVDLTIPLKNAAAGAKSTAAQKMKNPDLMVMLEECCTC
jgi:hypothetical protein